MTYKITYINYSTNRPVLNITIGASSLSAAKAKGSSYFQKHMRNTPRVTMLVEGKA